MAVKACLPLIPVSPRKLRGVGEGPVISHDALVSLRFLLASGTPSQPLEFVCGVIPDDCIPGDVVVGLSMHAKLGIQTMVDYSLRFTSSEAQSLRSSPPQPLHLQPLPFANKLRQPSTVFTTATPDQYRQLSDFSPTWPPEVHEFARQYPELFFPTGRKVARTTRIAHVIDTGNATPIRSHSASYSPIQELAIRLFVADGVRDGVIRKSSSPWSARALAVPKGFKGKLPRLTDEQVLQLPTMTKLPDGIKVRFCVDFRRLNAVTKKNAYPLPNIDKALNEVATHKYFCSIDLRDGFWQIPVHPDSVEKTAFTTPFGLYEFLVMPFGLTNAPATFQAFIDDILEPYRAITRGLIDDICIFADSRDELKERTMAVLGTLADNNLVLQLKKCVWFATEIKLLGRIVSYNSITPDPEKVRAILEYPEPTTITQVRGFLSTINYHKQALPRLTETAEPLSRFLSGNLKKGAKVTLDDAARTSFVACKDAIAKFTQLHPFQAARSWIFVDASDWHIGGALYQCSDRHSAADKIPLHLHPIAFLSRKLTETEHRYSTQEREAFAAVSALNYWRSWIEGLPISIVTDHESLATLRSQKEPTKRLIKFLDTIEHFDPVIIWRPGRTNVVADWLSRPGGQDSKVASPLDAFALAYAEDNADKCFASAYPTGEVHDPVVIDDPSTEDTTQMARVPLPEPSTSLPSPPTSLPPRNKPTSINGLDQWDLQEIFDLLLRGIKGSLDRDWVLQHFMSLGDAIYVRIGDDSIRRVLPEKDLLVALQSIHESQGHCSTGILLRVASKQFWHPTLALLVHRPRMTCTACQLNRKPPTIDHLHSVVPPADPFARWGMDFIGPLADNTHICTAIDYCTSWAFILPCSSPTTENALTAVKHICALVGSPAELIADNGKAFVSAAFVAALKEMGIRHHTIAPYRPQGNGKVERFNRTLKEIATPLAQANPSWPVARVFAHALSIYLARPMEHGYSPYYLAFGCGKPGATSSVYTAELSLEDEIDAARDRAATLQDLAGLRARLQSVKYARDTIRTSLQSDKAASRDFSLGDWVLRARPRRHKQEPFYEGPLQVIAIEPGRRYKLASPSGIELANAHHADNLFPAYTWDGEPAKCLWYGSKRLMEMDRKRWEQLATRRS